MTPQRDYLICDNSLLSTLKACSTMARYTYLDRRVSSRTALSRDVGTALHAALEHRYKVSGGSEPTSEVKGQMAQLLTDAYADIQLGEKDFLTLARMQAVLTAYNEGIEYKMGKGEHYIFAGYKQECFKLLAVEVPFAIDLGTVAGQRVIYTGRSDMLAAWDDGLTVVMDHKKVGRWESGDQMRWKVAAGPKGYAYSLPRYIHEGIAHLPDDVQAALAPQEELRKELAKHVTRVDGFCLNGIVVRREPESLARAKIPPTYFVRQLYTYHESILQEWREDALRWITQWAQVQATGAWTLNERSCSSYYGRPCPYYQICQYPKEQRALALSSDEFKDNTWNPLTREDEVTADEA